MLTGTVTADREATLRLPVCGLNGRTREIDTVIDTGFNGFLTLPGALVDALGLSYHSQTIAALADGRLVSLRKYEATVLWDARQRDVIVLQAEGGPLIGMSLLYGSRHTIEVTAGGRVTIEALPETGR